MLADYALLSDCHGAALVHRDGSVDWWPGPRFDGASVFSRFLDPDAGHFAVRAAGATSSTRRYLEGTLVLETEHRTPTGTLRVTDALALEPGARGHDIGRAVPHALVRVAEVLDGEVELEVHLRPRPEYGLAVPRLEHRAGRIESIGGPERVFLLGGEDLELDGGDARGRVRLRAGATRRFVLQRVAGLDCAAPEPLDAEVALAETLAAWRSWGEQHEDFDGPYAGPVAHAALVIQGLTYQPSGAVVAAATTSAPEILGGRSNWDYRYAWLRDASLVSRALLGTTCADEAERYFAWIVRAATSCRNASHVQIVFGPDGERFLEERSLDHLRGFADSRPVRVGNAAWRQQQLDVLGEVLDVALALDEGPGLELDAFTADFLCELVERAAKDWRSPDAGVWEDRDELRHHTVSKAMCWAALDRGVRLAGGLGEHADADRWARARDEIRETVLREAWSEERGAYTGTLGGDQLDAGVLLLPRIGFVDATDDRMRQTVAAIEAALLDDGLVRRREHEDEVGAFLPCSFWLASCHALAGDPEAARALVERALATANDVGLLAEMVDPASGALLGGLPQALSHVGLVTAAGHIAEAERDAAVAS